MAGRILVVDDVATNRIVLKAKLAIACYDVLQAADGAQALQIAHTERPDLILLDMAMPGMTGLDVLAALKGDPATAAIPVVVITSFADRRSKLAALRAGAEDFLSKPVDDMVLTARVRSLLRDHALSEEFDLRDGTRQALGFAEAQAGFAGPQTGADVRQQAGAGAGPQPHADANNDPARIALIGTSIFMAEGWRRALDGRSPHEVTVIDRAEALRLARNDRRDASGTANRDTGNMPDVFVVAADAGPRAEGLRLVSELRASPTTRQVPIVVVLAEGAEAEMPMALDLGASDLQIAPVDPDELSLRLDRQIARSRISKALRRQVADGLQLALTDPLTGLPNRRHALTRLDRVCSAAVQNGGSFALLMLDLDHFKQVNDSYGHAAGDAVLQSLAGRLQTHLRPIDLLARIGGEEFLAILPDIAPDQAHHVAERMRKAMAHRPVQLPASLGRAPGRLTGPEPLREVFQTLSIGLVIGPGNSDGPNGPSAHENAIAGLLSRADAALYEAKRAGRNRVATAHSTASGASRGEAAA